MIKCKNCQTEYEGNFCFNCGQTAKTYPIDFNFFKQDFSSNILKVNTGFFYTTRALIKRGGHFIYNYVQGKRMNYSTPISYLLFVIFLMLLIGEYVKTYNIFVEFKFSSNNPVANSIFKWLVSHTSYFMLIIIPLYSLASWIIFFKHKYNYFVHCLLNTYIIGFITLLYIVVSLFSSYIKGYYIEAIEFGLLYIGLTIFYAQFFKIKYWKSMLLVVLQFVLMITISFCILMLVDMIF